MSGQGAVYLFEAKGIQRYLADSGKLKDVIGASELIFQLARADGEDLLGEVIKSLNLDEKVMFARRASAAFMVTGEKESLLAIRQAWRLVVQLSTPGLEFSDTLQDIDGSVLDTMQACYQAGSGVRENGMVSLLPLANPFYEFVQRTGRARVSARTEELKDTLDQVIEPQYRAFSALKGADHQGVASRFLPGDVLKNKEAYVFPRNMDENDPDKESNPLFPLLENNSFVALIHADISGLGEVWQNISNAFDPKGDVCQLAEISKAIEGAIALAAKTATRKVLLKEADWERPYDRYVLPARPLVLGGDDLTLIVRADLAMSYTAVLLEEIEVQTKEELKKLRKAMRWLPNKPTYLSACAGVAYMKSTQPIAMASELAEDLCKYAKGFAKDKQEAPYPSCISFHVIRTSLQESYTDILEQDQQIDDGRLLISHPLYLGEKKRLPQFKTFEKLVLLLRDNKRGIGKLKSLKAELSGSKEVAKKIWLRWREIFIQTSSQKTIEEFDTLLIDLGVSNPKELPFDEAGKTPIFDAITLGDLGSKSEEEVGTKPRGKAAA